MITIERLKPADREQWEALFDGYHEFYGRGRSPEINERAWQEFETGSRMHARGAWLDGRLVGIVHFLVHASTTTPDVCYLQDLFTAPEARGQGVARALIEAVREWAREQGCSQLYWQTHESNVTGRRLYDRVAEFRGFIVYETTL
ncbi:GNAT family N-acetyltransferase [Luteipulveratus mongoliensis]|uniref:GNAT family acetyltransferase n=1 Tax=Luteipulveratus mongoliensis TaxID=571913 RepID=A0A0K1JG06_9MICO|nr:GNAT family N-acetyltransferase [Luteipulveratus mongoliensis]AKU15518.1 GNAT family acetyltransferase [Luteipulveratus mongoliensis]